MGSDFSHEPADVARHHRRISGRVLLGISQGWFEAAHHPCLDAVFSAVAVRASRRAESTPVIGVTNINVSIHVV